MKSNKILNYISNHPFIFLTSIVLVTSCCMGGLLTSTRIINFPPSHSSTTNTTPFNNHPTEILTVAVINTESPELTITSLNKLPASIITNTSSPKITSTLLFNTPTATTTLVPTVITPLVTTTLISTLSTSPLVIHFINVGQGDSILIVSPEGNTILIDGGSANTGVVNYLQRQGIQKVDVMIATHPNEDHIGGLIQVLEEMDVKKVITNGQSYTTSAYEHFLDAILNSNAEYIEAKRGDKITVGDLVFSVLSPMSNTGDDINNNSLVLRLIYGKTAILFMGDAGNIAEESILASGLPVQANIIKIGHHGSSDSSSPIFIDAVKPDVAIYSAGVNNQYHLPSPETINMLKLKEILVLGTDIYGTIIVTVTTDGYSITDTNGYNLGR
jgi:competence protein ComEC